MAAPAAIYLNDTAKAHFMADPLFPRPELLVKLGRLANHVQRSIKPHSFELDAPVLKQYAQDVEVSLWLNQMRDRGMLR